MSTTTAARVIVLPTFEPEGSSPDSGSTSTAALRARRRVRSLRALEAFVCPVSSTSEKMASTSSGVGAFALLSFLAMLFLIVSFAAMWPLVGQNSRDSV